MAEEKAVVNESKQLVKKEPFRIKKRYVSTLMLLVVLVLGSILFVESKHWEETEDAYVETHTVSVAPKVSGQIVKMLVKDNEKVKEGQLVAVIDPADYETKLLQASAIYEAALLRQKSAKAGFSAADSRIKLARKNLERYTELYKTGAVSKLEYDNAKIAYDNAQASLTQSEDELFSQGKNRVADANLKNLAALKKQAELNLRYTKIYAPQDGFVSNKNAEVGSYIQVGQPLFVVVPDEVWIVANYKENQVGKIKVGQRVEIKVDSYPKKTFEGRVDSIQRISGAKSSLFPPENAVGSFVKIVQRIPVKIVFTEKIDPSEFTIVAGMSVVPKVRILE